MKSRSLFLALVSLAAFVVPAQGRPEFSIEGFVQGRVVSPSDETSWTEGGLGKLRFDRGENPRVDVLLTDIYVEGHAQLTPSLSAMTTLHYEPQQRNLIEPLDAFVRYRPVSTSPLQGTIKLGAFFPPISLENDDIGWTSPWTLTPSAINSWVGEELRTIGGEGTLDWRAEHRTVSLKAGLYGWNDPTGILLADRGWAMGDRPTGLFERPRLPDEWAQRTGRAQPALTWEFLEIDDKPGWYAGAKFEEEGVGSIEFLRYDNEADPTRIREQVAWRTEFWSLGGRLELGPYTLLAQTMTGETEAKPSPFFQTITEFSSAFVLLGREIGPVRVAARADWFTTQETRAAHNIGEDGHAVTVAASWFLRDDVRLAGEILRLESQRSARTNVGLDPEESETQVQLSLQWMF